MQDTKRMVWQIAFPVPWGALCRRVRFCGVAACPCRLEPHERRVCPQWRRERKSKVILRDAITTEYRKAHRATITEIIEGALRPKWP